jgi:hypothetical protein
MNIEFERETVDEPCYVLRRISDIDRVKSGGGDKVETFNGFGLRFRNVPFKEWISRMEYYYSQNSLPVIDESGINENVDMDLNCSMKDMNALNSELAKYDLKFEKLPRKIGYGVIKSID